MPYTGPGTTIDGAAVYKTASLATILPPSVVTQIDDAGYADLDFAYGLSSEPSTTVTIGGTPGAPTIGYTDASGNPATLAVASVGAQGSNGFQFTDPSGSLWTVIDQAVAGATAADPVLDMAISMEAGDPVLDLALQQLKTTIDSVTGGNPIVFPTNPLDQPPCFARGTRIRTATGEVAVEDLAEGDRVVLATGGEAAITWIGRRRVHVGRHPEPASVGPVRIEAGALDGHLPHRALRVSPDHALLLDGVLVPAGLLVNAGNIVQETTLTVEYFHVELARHAVLLAEGAAAETYLDTGNRGTFANAPIVALNPGMMSPPNAATGAPCAEMVFGGERLERIRAAIAENIRDLRAAS